MVRRGRKYRIMERARRGEDVGMEWRDRRGGFVIQVGFTWRERRSVQKSRVCE